MKIQRGITGRLACGVTSALVLAAIPLPASADAPETIGFQLINVGSGKCFAPTAIDGNRDQAGLLIQQRTCDVTEPQTNEGAIQSYRFWFVGRVHSDWWCPGCIGADDAYIIKNELTGLCMDVRDGAKNDGAVAQQWTCSGDAIGNAHSMVWYSERNDFPGTVKLKNFNSDLCLDVRGGSADEGAQLQQFHCTSNNAAQEFWQMTAGALMTDLDLNGNWTDGSTRLADGSTLSARIFAGRRRIAIDMSNFGRANAIGLIDSPSSITVTFPDDRQYAGQLQPPNTIRWSKGSSWTRMP